ncbi:MAG: class I SAM-dependent methyltransferase [Chloroflexota bacterium]|nr:class I SAM-dependent methyltransferase [Chloroflexota bacterium]
MSHGVSSGDQRRLYSDLAWLWPIISPPQDYVEETERLCRTIQDRSRIEVGSLLHLGCGAGNNDYTLKEHFEVTGVDLSEDMLGMARWLNPQVAYAQGDMRTVRLGRSFDAVMLLDSVGYMLTEDDLRAAFATAFAHLNPRGLFLTVAEISAERFQQNETLCSTHASTATRGTLPAKSPSCTSSGAAAGRTSRSTPTCAVCSPCTRGGAC